MYDPNRWRGAAAGDIAAQATQQGEQLQQQNDEAVSSVAGPVTGGIGAVIAALAGQPQLIPAAYSAGSSLGEAGGNFLSSGEAGDGLELVKRGLAAKNLLSQTQE